MNQARKTNLIKSLSELEKQGVHFALVRVDETEHWAEDIAAKAGKIEGVYLVNLTEPTNICSFEVVYWAQFVGNFFEGVDGFPEDDITELERNDGGEPGTYFSERSTFHVAKEYGEEWDFEEALENERCNPTIC